MASGLEGVLPASLGKGAFREWCSLPWERRRLPREVGESPLLDVFESSVGLVLGDMA